MRGFVIALLVLLGLQFPLPAGAEQVLSIGVFANRSKDDAMLRWQPLGDYLEHRLVATKVRVLPLSQSEIDVAVRRNELDLLLTNPAHFIRLRQSYPLSGALATLVEEEDGVVTPVLGGVIFVRADHAEPADLQALRGKRIAALSGEHLGGYLAQVSELFRAGLKVPGDVSLLTPSQYHDDIVTAVLSGEADGGFIRTGILESMVAEGRLAWGQVRVLNSQALPGYPFVTSTRLYPEWAVVALPHLKPRLVGQIAASLLSIEPDDRVARAAGIHGFAIPADYLPVEELMRELRVPPFDVAPSFTWHDIWQRYAQWLIALGVLALISAASLVGLAVGRHRLLDSQHALRASEESLDRVLKGTDVGTWDWNVQTGDAVFNARWASMLGHTPEELGHATVDVWMSRVHPDDLKTCQARLFAHFRGDTTQYQCEYRLRHRDGHWVWIEDRGKVVAWTSDHQPQRMAGTHTVITERKLVEDQMRLSASFLAAAQEGVMVTDADNIITDVNPAFTIISGYTREEVIGQRPNMLSSGRHGPEFYRQMWAQLEREGSWRGEIWNRRKNGDVFPEQLSITALRDDAGELTHYVAVLSDISYLKEHEQELRRMAHYDALTGLPNRRLLSDRIQQAFAQTRRRGDEMAIVVLDLDDFKPINDALGHEAGDRVLKEVAQRLRQVLRGGDTAARLGGDEFVLVLLNLDDRGECEQALERILDALAKPITLDRGDIQISASLGATIFPADDADPDTLLRHADQAMYRAKQEGRNRFHVFDARQDRAVSVLREEVVQLTRALKAGEFVLYYQPKVEMRLGALLGVEALLRWQHPERGLLLPADFLGLVEGSEHEVALGRWVIHAALSQMRAWRESGFTTPVSVNISVRHLMHEGFVRDLSAALGDFPDIAASDLEFEILERAAVDDWAMAAQVLNECHELGVSFSLDDFGTGYSSLLQLRRLNAQTLKIDQHFVRDMLDDPEDLIIVESVIRLSESFRLSVVAEGVETDKHAAALVALGCSVGQGYGIARPMPASELPVWAAGWHGAGFWRRLGEAGFGH